MTLIVAEELRRCPHCRKQYPRTKDYWYIRTTAADGVSSWCKVCMREANRMAAKKRYGANPNKYIEARRNHRYAYPEKEREAKRKWLSSHPEENRAKGHRRRAKERNLPHTLTIQEWENILADYNYQCAYCPKTWADCKLTQDHVVPVDQGGGYTADNIVPACRPCNSRKNNRTPEQAGMPITKGDKRW